MAVLNLQVSSSADDSYGDGTSGTQTPVLTDATNSLGTANTSDTKPRVNAFRFQNVTIPRNTVIVSAILRVCSNGDFITTDGVWYGAAVDNQPAFTTTADELASIPRTTANVPWNENISRTAGVFYSLPSSGDLKSIVQEIVNRSGWNSGNALAILGLGAANSNFASITIRKYDFSPASGATLVITTAEPAGVRESHAQFPKCRLSDACARN